MTRNLCFILLMLPFLTGCGTTQGAGAAAGTRHYPIRIVATTGMVADLVRNVGGSQVELTQIMGAGVDPHLYKATRDDVQAIVGGDLVFYSGLMLEGKMADTLARIGESKRVIAVTDSLDPAILLTPAGGTGHHDPHVWMDVSAWSQCAETVVKALTEYDPDHAATYRQNADVYLAALQKLHAYGIDSIRTVPEAQRVLITSHDAFSYFGRAYHIEVFGIQGLSTESEAGLQRINELVDLLVKRQIRAVFVESSVPRKNVEALVEGVRSRGHEISIGGVLFSDAMGETGTYEGTYVGMLDHNITTVTRALGGDAPARGLNQELSPLN
jgi:manganese/zinc/iron transport system substrate-binding protein